MRQRRGLGKPLSDFCDGDRDTIWTDGMVEGNSREYFWMNFEQPTTRVRQVSDVERVMMLMRSS
jgi:hypothetical protein